jgi:hypothetical protein
MTHAYISTLLDFTTSFKIFTRGGLFHPVYEPRKSYAPAAHAARHWHRQAALEAPRSSA